MSKSLVALLIFVNVAFAQSLPEKATTRIKITSTDFENPIYMSGVCIAKNEKLAIIITNAHGFYKPEFKDKLNVTDLELHPQYSKYEYKARLIVEDKSFDLAAVLCDGKGWESVELLKKTPDVWFYNWQHPRGELNQTARNGHLYGWEDDGSVAIRFHSVGGASGSGIFTKEGKLAAVLWGSIPEADLTFAIPAEKVQKFVKKHLEPKYNWVKP